MKKIIFSLVLAITLQLCYAQNEKGSMLVGVNFGNISFTNSESKTTYSNTPIAYKSDGSNFSISLSPNVAWFIKKNLAVGGGISLSIYNSNSKSSNTGSTTTSDNRYSQPSIYIGPMARYYFGGSNKGMPFVQANLQYGVSGGKSKSTVSTGSSSETKTLPKGDWNAGVSFGYEHFINKNIGFFGSIGFNYGSSKTTYEYRPSTGTGYDYTSEYSRFYVPVNVGLQIHLARKSAK